LFSKLENTTKKHYKKYPQHLSPGYGKAPGPKRKRPFDVKKHIAHYTAPAQVGGSGT
jgi:hypothetical protein